MKHGEPPVPTAAGGDGRDGPASGQVLAAYCAAKPIALMMGTPWPAISTPVTSLL